MKKVILFAAFMLAACCGFSQGPSYPINYQAVVRNGSGTLVPMGTTVNFRFSILEASASGAVLYSETQSALVNNNQGLVNVAVGEGAAIVGVRLWSANFSDNTKDKYLQVEMDPTGGTSFTNLGASKLQGVPFANNALTANYALNSYWSKSAITSPDIYYDAGDVNIGVSTPTGIAAKVNIEKTTVSGRVLSVKQTGSAAGGSYAIYAQNDAMGTDGIAVYGFHASHGKGIFGNVGGNGTGVFGTAGALGGIGVQGYADIGVKAVTASTNGIAIELDGFMKVSGSKKTAFKTSALVAAAGSVNLSYGGASSTDIILVTPVSSSYTMPAWQLLWNTSTSAWQIWNASDDGSPSNFPAGTSFNILVIKQ